MGKRTHNTSAKDLQEKNEEKRRKGGLMKKNLQSMNSDQICSLTVTGLQSKIRDRCKKKELNRTMIAQRSLGSYSELSVS
jgi:hypothetical protein